MKSLVVVWSTERVPAGANDLSHQHFSDLAIKAHDDACEFFNRDDIASCCVPMERNNLEQTVADYCELRRRYINGADIVYFSEGWCQDPLCMADYQYCLDTNKTFLAYNPLGYKYKQYKDIDFGKDINDSWIEFKRSGFLWFINAILHAFGWEFVLTVKDNEVISAYPRVFNRGINEESDNERLRNLMDHMKENVTTFDGNLREEEDK